MAGEHAARTCDCRACTGDWPSEGLTGIEKQRLENRRELAMLEEHTAPPMLTFTELLDRFIETCRGEVRVDD